MDSKTRRLLCGIAYHLTRCYHWFLKIYENGKYCTFPHAIEFLNRPYAQIFPILTAYDELANYLSPFMDAWEGGAQDQLQGQIASAKIPLSRMISPALYWVMTGDDFSLDINNPDEPKSLLWVTILIDRIFIRLHLVCITAVS